MRCLVYNYNFFFFMKYEGAVFQFVNKKHEQVRIECLLCDDGNHKVIIKEGGRLVANKMIAEMAMPGAADQIGDHLLSTIGHMMALCSVNGIE